MTRETKSVVSVVITLPTHTYLQLSFFGGDKRQPEIRLRSQARSSQVSLQKDKKFKDKPNGLAIVSEESGPYGSMMLVYHCYSYRRYTISSLATSCYFSSLSSALWK